jgi:hypothetical protein
LAERFTCTENVEGSIPFSGSNKYCNSLLRVLQ